MGRLHNFLLGIGLEGAGLDKAESGMKQFAEALAASDLGMTKEEIGFHLLHSIKGFMKQKAETQKETHTCPSDTEMTSAQQSIGAMTEGHTKTLLNTMLESTNPVYPYFACALARHNWLGMDQQELDAAMSGNLRDLKNLVDQAEQEGNDA